MVEPKVVEKVVTGALEKSKGEILKPEVPS
jgi:hypothetical protein